MWVIFGIATGEKFVIELSDSETVQDLRDLLHTEFDQPLDVIIACGSYFFSNPREQLKEIPCLNDMTEVTLEVPGCCRGRVRESNPTHSIAFSPAPRRKTTSDVLELLPETVKALPPLRPISHTSPRSISSSHSGASARKGVATLKQTGPTTEATIVKPSNRGKGQGTRTTVAVKGKSGT